MNEWISVDWNFLARYRRWIFFSIVSGFLFSFSIMAFIPKHWQATVLVQTASESPFVAMERLGMPSLLDEAERRSGIPGLAKTMLPAVYGGGHQHLSTGMISGAQNVLMIRYWDSNPVVARRGVQAVADVLIAHENEIQEERLKNISSALAELNKRIADDSADLQNLKASSSSDAHVQRILFYDSVIAHDRDQVSAYKKALADIDVSQAQIIEAVSVSTIPVFPTLFHKISLGCALSIFLSLVLIYIRRER